MGQTVTLTTAHWLYLVGVIAIVVTMIRRENVVVPAIVATLAVAWAWSGSGVQAITSVLDRKSVV